MLLRLLIGLATAGTVAGAATAFALTNGSSHSRDDAEVIDLRTEKQENTDLGPEFREEGEETKGAELERQTEAKITEPHVPQTKVEEKVEFQGKLVFTRGLSGLERRTTSTSIYIGEVFDNNEYQEQKEKWKNQDREDGDDTAENEDKEAHITIDLSPKKLRKDKGDFKSYLDVFNEKIKKSSENGHLKKLEESLKGDKEDFEKIFGSETYNELIQKIQDLKGTPKK